MILIVCYFLRNDEYVLFDPHYRSTTTGLRENCDVGKAVMIYFQHRDSLECHINQLYHGDLEKTFTLYGYLFFIETF